MRTIISKEMMISIGSLLSALILLVGSAAITEAAELANSFAFPVGYPDGTGYSISGWDFLDDEGMFTTLVKIGMV